MRHVLHLTFLVIVLSLLRFPQDNVQARPYSYWGLDGEPLVRPPRSNDLFGYGSEKPRSYKSLGGKFKVWGVEK